MDALAHLRHLIASLDEVLVDALCARARFRRNEALYALADDDPPDLDMLAGRFSTTATLAGRTRLLRPAYLRRLMPALCLPGTDDSPAPCLSADAACLDALARRLSLSVHVATRKREALPEDLQEAIRTGEPRLVEQAITYLPVEQVVRSRVSARAAGTAPRPDTPNAVAALYDEWIIPLSRKIQVAGLLA
ncbi:MAG: hypothetical protein GX548_02260 [Lentisphaerae bacterium]|nr:hypothetical protein [Lentisphaerota bacterium]